MSFTKVYRLSNIFTRSKINSSKIHRKRSRRRQNFPVPFTRKLFAKNNRPADFFPRQIEKISDPSRKFAAANFTTSQNISQPPQKNFQFVRIDLPKVLRKFTTHTNFRSWNHFKLSKFTRRPWRSFESPPQIFVRENSSKKGFDSRKVWGGGWWW